MNWNQAIREERAMLQRIIALLLSLADLAEQASRGPQAACDLLFWILCPVAYAASASIDLSSDPCAAQIRAGDSRLDLTHLAIRFRELACMLQCQANLTAAHENGAIRDYHSLLASRVLRSTNIVTALAVACPFRPPDTS